VETSTSFTRKKDENKEMDDESGGRERPISPARSDDAGPSSFEFSWKAQLKQIDDDFDVTDEPIVSPAGPGAPNVLRISGNVETHASVPLMTQSFTSKGTQPPTVDDVFGGSPSSPMGPFSQPPSPPAFGASRSLTPESGVVKRPKRRAVVVDSDDELGDSSINSSRKVPHPINTPKSRSSPTPPTSDMDMSAAKPQSKGKGKTPVASVPRLLFDKDLERSLEAPHAKKSIQKGKRKDKESRPKIKVFMISSSINCSGH
jgi:mediator of replication checkpoint protein 1